MIYVQFKTYDLSIHHTHKSEIKIPFYIIFFSIRIQENVQ